MAITLTRVQIAEVITLALSGKDHRGVILDEIDRLFVIEVLEFFQQVVNAKMHYQPISLDWFREHFLNPDLSSKEIMQAAGLNDKTIKNKRGSARKEIVIEEAWEHHDKFMALIESLVDEDINVNLSLTLRGVTVELDLNETLVVVNVLAVKRATIRGGSWSTLGKQVESPLMTTMCRLFGVDSAHHTRILAGDDSFREVDYYLIPPEGDPSKCEVKLMGKGNPESADAVVARGSRVFVASTMSEKNKTQMNNLGVLWTELQVPNGILRFQQTLNELCVPYTPSNGFSESEIESAVRQTLAL